MKNRFGIKELLQEGMRVKVVNNNSCFNGMYGKVTAIREQTDGISVLLDRSSIGPIIFYLKELKSVE